MAFEGPPRIIRIWGKGRPIENGSRQFDEFVANHHVKTLPGSRSIIVVDVHQVASSCGFSVPFYDFKGYRSTLNDFFAKKEKAYNSGKADESMDRHGTFLVCAALPG
jgi:hypothetical protein